MVILKNFRVRRRQVLCLHELSSQTAPGIRKDYTISRAQQQVANETGTDMHRGHGVGVTRWSASK